MSEHAPARRMTLSEIVDRMLTRSGERANSTVTLTRNAKGETQIEVEVRTGEGGIQTIEDASAKAREVYEQARNRYPLASGHTGAQSSQAPSS